MKCLIAVTCASLALAGCTVSEEDSTAALSSMGFTDVKLGGWPLFGCDEKDGFKRTFAATGADGRPVHGVVCGGVFKGATVRITGRG